MCKDVLASLLDESNLKEKGFLWLTDQRSGKELPQPELGAAGDFVPQSGSKK